jgi:hypothetical protein
VVCCPRGSGLPTSCYMHPCTCDGARGLSAVRGVAPLALASFPLLGRLDVKRQTWPCSICSYVLASRVWCAPRGPVGWSTAVSGPRLGDRLVILRRWFARYEAAFLAALGVREERCDHFS